MLALGFCYHPSFRDIGLHLFYYPIFSHKLQKRLSLLTSLLQSLSSFFGSFHWPQKFVFCHLNPVFIFSCQYSHFTTRESSTGIAITLQNFTNVSFLGFFPLTASYSFNYTYQEIQLCMPLSQLYLHISYESILCLKLLKRVT